MSLDGSAAVDATAPPAAARSPVPGLAAARVLLLAGGGITLLAHAVAPLFVAPEMWGLGTWTGLPPAWRTFALALGALLLVSAPRLDAWLGARLGSPRAPLPWILGGVLVLLFLALRSEVFWANAIIASKAAARGEVTLKHVYASAGAAAIARIAGAASGLYHGDTGYVLLSAFSGGVFVPGAFALGRALFPGSTARARGAALVLVTAGWSQMFFGVVETYTPALPAQVWTLAWVVRLLRLEPDPAGEPAGKTGERVRAGLWALFCFSVGVGIFAAVLVLGPAVALALLLRRPSRIDLAYVVVPALPIVLAAVLFLAFGRDPDAALSGVGGSDGQTWVALTRAEGGRNFHFELFSLAHLDARLQVLSLNAPAWLPLLLLGFLGARERARDDRAITLVLLVAALASASYAVLVNPDMGPPLEWMQSACGIVAPYVWLVWWGLRAVPEAFAARAGVALAGLSLVHTLPWVLVNARVLV